MECAFAQAYEALYHEHWWWRAREEMLVELLRERQPKGGWRSILDVGCGNGLFFDRLEEFGKVEGVESCPEIVTGDSRHAARIRIAPFDASFQPGRRYGLILLLDILEHLDKPAEALRHALSLLAANGLIVITLPAFPVLWTSHDALNHHRARFTRSSFRAVATAAGMRILADRYFFHWIFPARLAMRAVEKVWETKPRIPRVPPHWLNRALWRISRAEQRLFRKAPLPFGSSLLVLGARQ